MELTMGTHTKSALETLGIIFPVLFLTTLVTNLRTTYMRNVGLPLTFAFQFLVQTVPIIFIMTIFANYTVHVNVCLILLNAVLILTTRNYTADGDGDVAPEIKEHTGKKPFVTNLRSTINILTVVAILAVDFTKFPARFHKTHGYGISLMDIGVGVYVFANGIVAPEIRGHKNTIKKTFLDVTPLLVIGIARFVLTKEMDYHVDVTEYGRHWNFFITLAITRLISVIIMSASECNMTVCGFEGFCILFIHQILLNLHLEEYVLGSAPRDNFIDANREGIVSTLGYIGLYFLSVSYGFLLHNKSKLKLHVQLTVTTATIAAITILLHANFNISRRLANSTYCMWILFLGTLMTTLYYILQEFQNNFYANVKNVVHAPFIFDAINFNGLTFFLVANVLTGCINMVFNTKKISTVNTLVILSVYLLLTCLIVTFLYTKKIKLKI